MRLILCEAGKFGGMLRLMLEERKYLLILRGFMMDVLTTAAMAIGKIALHIA